MLHPKVLEVLELLDSQFQQDGLPRFRDLQVGLDEARRHGNRNAEADLSLEMGIRLYSIAAWSRALARTGTGPDLIPEPGDALEPAIEVLSHCVEVALDIGEEAYEKLARNYLAKCYAESGQLEKALDHLRRLLEICRMPEDALVCFDAAQKAGDCCLELEDDESALMWYRRGMSIAQELDDPFEIQVQLGKMASALGNLKRYDEALRNYEQARDLLIRIGNDEGLRRKIRIHKNLFNVAALPNLIAYVEERISHMREALGRALLRDLPEQLAAGTLRVLTNRDAVTASNWPVFRGTDTAVRSATTLLAGMLGDTDEIGDPDEPSTLHSVGSLCRRHFGDNTRDPEDLMEAARFLVQVDRSRRAALHVQKAEASTAGPGPFGGGNSRHVVYLRSFVASPHLPRVDVAPWGQVNLEELFACLLDRSPLIALGYPNIEQFGPGRAITNNENWREVLRALAMEAQMLLVVPAQTGGTSWEIEWVTTNKFLHKTCFVMPPPGAGEESWWADNWHKLREWAVRLGLNLPEYTPEGCVFRLTTEGQVDRIDFSAIYNTSDLHMTLLVRLLYKLNISYDFAYGLQQGLAQDEGPKPRVDEPVDNTGPDAPEELATLRTLTAGKRFELSNWYFDSPQVPHAPGVLLLYETPFRMLWAEGASDLHDALDRHAQGEASDFTRAFLHHRVLPILKSRQIEQLQEQKLEIESVIGFRVKQLVSYRFCVVPSSQLRKRVLDLIWSGTSDHGAPQLPRPRR